MKKYSLYIILMLATLCAKAQNGVNSPYSRYGFGLLSDRSMGFNAGMAGTAQGFRNGTQVNIANPASYSGVDSLTMLFDLGLTLQNGNYEMGNSQQNVKNSSFDHFAFQFRAAKNLGVTVGVMPIANTKYAFSSQAEVLPGTENTSSSYSFSGDGGLREVIIGAGWRPFKPVSIGVNASYVWGDFAHNMVMSLNQTSAYDIRRSYTADITTYNLQAGLQLIMPVSKTDRIVAGATYTLGHNVNSDAFLTTQTTKSVATSYGTSTVVQTQTVDTARNAFQLPHSLAVGLTYYRSNRLRIGVDAEVQKWGDCRFPVEEQIGDKANYNARKGALYDRKRVSAGLDWTPRPEATRGYLRRITYKVGGYYSQSYANADLTGRVTDKPKEFGLTAGFSLPIQNSWANQIYENFSRINVAVQWAHTSIPYLNSATMRQSELTENYLRLNIGVTINEHWFYKWKLR